jgi:hypothetical protein
LLVRIAVSDTAHAALRILPKLRERVNVVHYPLTVYTQLGLRREARKRECSNAQSKSMIELPSIDSHIGDVSLSQRSQLRQPRLETLSRGM